MKYVMNTKFGKISKLGFGAMRFPKIGELIDQDQVNKMIKHAYESGVNYFDTAYVYGDGASEIALGKALKQFPRDSFFVADKLPYFNLTSLEQRDEFLNTSLERVGVDYFDFYLVHAVNADDAPKIKQYDVINWAIEKKAQGKIKYIGVSMHDNSEFLTQLLDMYNWDFVQIQYNYMDTNHEPGTAGYEQLINRNIPIVIMEPLKGGVLANIPEHMVVPFKDIEKSPVEMSFRWLNEKDGILTILSGMSTIEQTINNCEIFSNLQPLTAKENIAIDKVVENILNSQKVGCTGCAYCMPCPMGIDIPATFKAWNTRSMNPSSNWISGTDIDIDIISKCISCGKCVGHCPQKINVPAMLSQIIKEQN